MAQTGLKRFNDLITNANTQNYLTQVLGAKKSTFVNNLTALVANNVQLQQCEPVGVMYAAIKATALDLPFDGNLGYAYVIPYKNTRERRTDAQFQIGWRGYVQLAQRSGNLSAINVRDVRAGEVLGEDFVSGELQFKQLSATERTAAPIIGYVAFFRLTNGFQKMLYMTVEELCEHAGKYSQTYRNASSKANSKWTTDFDAMAKKTVVKLLLNRWCPLSVEMQQAISADQAVIGENNTLTYVDNDSANAVILPDAEVVEHTQAMADQIMGEVENQTEGGHSYE